MSVEGWGRLRWSALAVLFVAWVVGPGCRARAPQDPTAQQPTGRTSTSRTTGPGKLTFVPQLGHASQIQAFAAAADGPRFATAGDDGVVKVWDRGSRRLLRSVQPFPAAIAALSIDGHGDHVLAVARHEVAVVRVADGEVIYREADFDTDRWSGVLSSDAGWFALAGSNGVQVRSLPGGEVLRSTSDDATALALTGDGGLLVGMRSGLIVSQDAKAGIESGRWHEDAPVSALDSSPDGKHLAIARADGVTTVWDTTAGKRVAVIEAEPSKYGDEIAELHAVELVSGNRVVSSVEDRVEVWSFEGSSPRRLWVSLSPLRGVVSPAFASLDDDGEMAVVAAGQQVHHAALVSSPDREDGWSFAATEDHLPFLGTEVEPPDSLAYNSAGDRLIAGSSLWHIGHAARMARQNLLGQADLVGFVGDDHIVVAAGQFIRVTDALRDEPPTVFNHVRASGGNPDARTANRDLRISALTVAPDQRHYVTADNDGRISLWDRRSNKGSLLAATHTAPTCARFSPSGRYLGLLNLNGEVGVLEPEQGTFVATAALTGDESLFMSTPGQCVWQDEETLLLALGPRIVAFDVVEHGMQEVSIGTNQLRALAYDPARRWLAGGQVDGVIRVWGPSGELIRTWSQGGLASSIEFSPDGRWLAVATGSETRLWDLTSDDDAWIGLATGGGEWIIYTHDGYFDASPGGVGLVAAFDGDQAYSIEQFAYAANRPDIIVERLVADPDPTVLNTLRTQVRRRLTREQMEVYPYADLSTLPRIDELRARRRQDDVAAVTFGVNGRDARYHVYVNNVAVAHGDASAEVTLDVELAAGENVIEVSAEDARGIEGPRSSATVTNPTPSRPHLYFVGLGTSRYDDPELRLEYAAKDALDLQRAFQGLAGRSVRIERRGLPEDWVELGGVHTHVIPEDEIGSATILGTLDEFERPPRADDLFVLFVAGHGIYDLTETPRYYYLTKRSRLENVAETGVPFDVFEALLTKTPARHRLFLVDTCESGERDDDTADVLLALDERAPPGAELIRRGLRRSRGNPITDMDRRRLAFVDLRRRTGSIVISSSAGDENSFESRTLKNGVFTHALLAALRGEARGSDDMSLTTRELLEHLQQEVATATGDRQHPTIDRDNTRVSFALPIDPPALEQPAMPEGADDRIALACDQWMAPTTEMLRGTVHQSRLRSVEKEHGEQVVVCVEWLSAKPTEEQADFVAKARCRIEASSPEQFKACDGKGDVFHLPWEPEF